MKDEKKFDSMQFEIVDRNCTTECWFKNTKQIKLVFAVTVAAMVVVYVLFFLLFVYVT